MSNPSRLRLGVSTASVVLCGVPLLAMQCASCVVWMPSSEWSPSATRREVDVPVCVERSGRRSIP